MKRTQRLHCTQRSLSSVATLDNRDRLVPSTTAAVLAVQRGAHMVRVHDVRETVQALKVLAAVQQSAGALGTYSSATMVAPH